MEVRITCVSASPSLLSLPPLILEYEQITAEEEMTNITLLTIRSFNPMMYLSPSCLPYRRIGSIQEAMNQYFNFTSGAHSQLRFTCASPCLVIKNDILPRDFTAFKQKKNTWLVIETSPDWLHMLYRLSRYYLNLIRTGVAELFDMRVSSIDAEWPNFGLVIVVKVKVS